MKSKSPYAGKDFLIFDKTIFILWGDYREFPPNVSSSSVGYILGARFLTLAGASVNQKSVQLRT